MRIALPTLARLIQLEDPELLQDACWALSYLSDGDDRKIQSVLQADVAIRLVQLLGYVFNVFVNSLYCLLVNNVASSV